MSVFFKFVVFCFCELCLCGVDSRFFVVAPYFFLKSPMLLPFLEECFCVSFFSFLSVFFRVFFLFCLWFFFLSFFFRGEGCVFFLFFFVNLTPLPALLVLSGVQIE